MPSILVDEVLASKQNIRPSILSDSFRKIKQREESSNNLELQSNIFIPVNPMPLVRVWLAVSITV